MRGAWVTYADGMPVLGSVRGLVPLHNHRGKRWSVQDIQRWLLLNRTSFDVDKVDLFDVDFQGSRLMPFLEQASDANLRLSLRATCATPSGDLRPLRETGLFDLFLTPPPGDESYLRTWLDAARDAGLPVRLQCIAPWLIACVGRDPVSRLVDGGVKVVHFAAWDPFVEPIVCPDLEEARKRVDYLSAISDELDAAGIEVNLVGIPRSLLTEKARRFAQDGGDICNDHQHYESRSFAWARRLYARRANVARIALATRTGGGVSRFNQIDNIVFQFLLHRREWLLRRVLFAHRLTRFSRFFASVPRVLEPDEAVIPPARERMTLDRVLARAFRKAFPTLEAAKDAVSPSHPEPRRRYYDPVDQIRLDGAQASAALAAEARMRITNTAPDLELGQEIVRAENGHTEPTSGAARWYGGANVEKRSAPLGVFRPPFSIEVTFGGGHAEYAGFAIGQYGRVLCPMVAPSHRIALHAGPDGRYVLTRDDIPVPPARFEDTYHVPALLAERVVPRIALWNIDGTVVTQPPRVWTAAQEPAADTPGPRFSVVTVCTRYARRLQAMLLTLARQRDFDVSAVEVLVAYVPGLDATEDVLDSVRAACPRLPIVRVPYDASCVTAKGLLINETIRLARADWIILLDADILVPPDFLKRLDEAAVDGVNFIAPDGRKMLDAETTARILLGMTDAVAAWEDLAQGAGEFRYREAFGTPVGYCQCVRRACFEQVPYKEYGHFEGADYTFAVEMRAAFGQETRMEGLPVLHMDHGMSQWYGARRHS